MIDLAVILLAYGLGCLQTGYYLTRSLCGQDLRRLGSGSTGARNAGRVLGPKGFLITLAGDVAKGVAAMAVAMCFGASPWVWAGALCAVTAGHVWPLQLGGHGGRGVAVGLGALAMGEPRLLAAFAGIALIGSLVCRRLVIGGMLAFAALPAAAWWMGLPMERLTGVVGLAVIVLWAHRPHLVKALRPGPRIVGADISAGEG